LLNETALKLESKQLQPKLNQPSPC
jgi:hypothetical protein